MHPKPFLFYAVIQRKPHGRLQGGFQRFQVPNRYTTCAVTSRPPHTCINTYSPASTCGPQSRARGTCCAWCCCCRAPAHACPWCSHPVKWNLSKMCFSIMQRSVSLAGSQEVELMYPHSPLRICCHHRAAQTPNVHHDRCLLTHQLVDA